jgi:cob(I)alamin adenosyltransferase
MLYTRKGDNGTTKTLASKERFSKSSSIAEALGALDELNSLIGLCKARPGVFLLPIDDNMALSDVLHNVQEKLFIIQAEIAGSNMTVREENVHEIEKIIDSIEQKLPPIKSFFIPGGDELSAMLDFTRTVARRAERRVTCARDENMVKISLSSMAYLNRLSSLFYALARIVNYEKGVEEKEPRYK